MKTETWFTRPDSEEPVCDYCEQREFAEKRTRIGTTAIIPCRKMPRTYVFRVMCIIDGKNDNSKLI